MADVFISYSQRAPEPTQTLAAELIQRGMDAWFDVNMLPGQAFGKVIDAEIDRAKAVITIWSRPALTSTYVPAESERALRQDKLICVRTSDVDPNELPTPFNRIHASLVTDLDAIMAALATKGLRQGRSSIDALLTAHGALGEAAVAWQSLKDSTDPSELQAFLEYFHAAPFYRLLATRKLERMRVTVFTTPAPAVASLPRPEDVTIRIEPGMHTGVIKRIALSADGRLLATGSDDKTVRLWSLPEGKLIRTLRPPIGPGNDGKVFAVALAPDGSWAAAGGWDVGYRSEVEGACHVLVFDTATGVVRARLGPLPNVINDLEVSRDGGRLAAGLFGTNGVRVWETAGWRQVAEDRDYGNSVYGLAFAADGRLAATSYDGAVRVYGADGRLVRNGKAPGGARPVGLAFAPDGSRLAVGYKDMRVDVLASDTLAHLVSPDTSGIDGDLSSLAWADGTRLAAAGNYPSGQQRLIVVWADGGRGPRCALPGPANTVMDLCAWRGGLAFGAYDPAFGLLDADGRRVLFRGPPLADLRGKRFEHFLVSADGRRVRFGLKLFSEDPWLFDLGGPALAPSPAAPADLGQADTKGLPIDGWINTAAPTLRGTALPLEQYEMARSLAILPDRQSFILGTEWSLRRFDAAGKELWQQPVPGAAWGVNLARDGRLILAAYGDGTIRWHRAGDGTELLALFIHVPDDPKAAKRWVLWTPEGYYDASPGADDLIGWHVNRGLDQAADFFPADTFRSTFHKPDIVRAALDQADVKA